MRSLCGVERHCVQHGAFALHAGISAALGREKNHAYPSVHFSFRQFPSMMKSIS
jgi:hypothetical protein